MSQLKVLTAVITSIARKEDFFSPTVYATQSHRKMWNWQSHEKQQVCNTDTNNSTYGGWKRWKMELHITGNDYHSYLSVNDKNTFRKMYFSVSILNYYVAKHFYSCVNIIGHIHFVFLFIWYFQKADYCLNVKNWIFLALVSEWPSCCEHCLLHSLLPFKSTGHFQWQLD